MGDGQVELAIQMAERAVALTGRQHPVMLDTLAAAYAAAGRFQDAVGTAQAASSLARRAGAAALAERIESRLRIYMKRQPYVRTWAIKP